MATVIASSRRGPGGMSTSSARIALVGAALVLTWLPGRPGRRQTAKTL